MTNPIKGETPLVLADGRAFTLVLDHSALIRAAQAYTGRTKLNKLFADMQPALDARGKVLLDEDGDPVKDTIPATAALLFGAFDCHHPEITLRDAHNILMGNVDQVGSALAAAVSLAFPDQSAGGNAQAPRPNGKTSGGSGAKRGSSRKTSGA